MKQILRGMIENKLTPSWGAQVRHEACRDKEMLELMRRSNCDRVYVGFESINPKTLELYNKKETLDNIVEAIETFHSYNVKIHGMFVLGSDEDDVATIRETLKFAKKHHIDTLQLMVLTPIPGSRDFKAFQDNKRALITRDWTKYDGHHVVHVPAKMTPYELQVESMVAMRDFYSLKRAFARLIRGDWMEFFLRGAGHYVLRNWHKKNKPYEDELRQALLQPLQTDLPKRLHSLLGKRITVSSIGASKRLQQMLETFLSELGANVVDTSEKISTAVADGRKYLTEKGKSMGDSLRQLMEYVKFDADVIVLLPSQEFLKTYADKMSQSMTDMSNSIRSSVKNLPNIIHLTSADFESIRDALTGLGLMLTDDLRKIADARDKVLSMPSV